MTLEGLAALVQAHRHLGRGAPAVHAAVHAVPELIDGLPALVDDGRGAKALSACADVLRGPAEAVVAEAAAAKGPAPAVADLERRLAADPLVAAVVALAREGAAISPAAATVPFLQTLALTAARARSEGGDLEKLGRVALAVVARLGAACARLEAAGVRVPALAAAAATSRAAAVWPRGAPAGDPTPAMVAAVLGAPVPAALTEAALVCVEQAIVAALARRSAGKATPDDGALLLRFVPPALADAGAGVAATAVARDPDAALAVLPDPSRWIDVPDLTAARVDAALAKRLLEPATGLAAAAALADALRELRRWEVLALLAGAVGPAPEGKRGLVVPRGGPAKAAVVAVGLGRLRAEATRKQPDGAGLAAIDAAWADMVRGARAVAADLGHAGVLVFEDGVDALRFALGVGNRLGGPVPVGIGAGALHGGTDGVAVRVSGPALDGALRWMAVGPAPARPGAGLGVQHLSHAGGWLCGNGVGIDAAAEEIVQEARIRHGLATALDGPPAGDPRVPRSMDLHRAFELDGAVVAVVRIGGVAGGFEVLRLPVPEWRALLDRDGEIAEQPTPPRAPRPAEAAPAPEPAVAGEADGWEASEPDEEADPVLLDLAEESGPLVLPDPADAFDTANDEFATEEEGRPEVSEPVTGFFLPGLDATTGASQPWSGQKPKAPAPTPSFDMEVVDDEDEDEDGPLADPFALPREQPVRGVAGASFTDDDELDPFAVDSSQDDPNPPGDPFHDVQAKPAGDPFARAAAPAAGPAIGDDPFAAVDPFAEGDGDDPFSEKRAAPAGRADLGDPFAGEAAKTEDDDPFADFQPLAAPSLGGPADAFAEPDPFTQEEDRPDEGDGPSFADVFSSPPIAAPAAAPAPEKPKRPPVRTEANAPAIDFEYLLRGYAWFNDGGQAVFGRPYGARMVDRHTYPYGGDPDAVYLTFLRDKISEGFVPRTELMGDLPPGATPQPLENDRLARAWSRLS